MPSWVWRVVERHLRRRLPAGAAGPALGDLAEDYEGQRRSLGRLRSALWLLREARSLSQSYEPDRSSSFRLECLWRESRLAVRSLTRARWHSAAIVALLAVAIGANVAMFSLVNAVMLRELPVQRPAELVAVKRMSRDVSQGVSFPLYEALRERWQSMSGLIAVGDVSPAFSLDAASSAGVENVFGTMVSGNYFRVLGVNVAVGRALTEDDDRFEDPRPVIVISHTLWQTRFGGAPEVVGRSVWLAGSRFTIVGITPAAFRNLGGDRGIGGDYWVPLNMQPIVGRGGDRRRNAGASMLRVMGRLRDGVSMRQAQAEAAVLTGQLSTTVLMASTTIHVFDGSRGLGDATARRYWPALRLLSVTVALILLMACANIASLLLARATNRQREVAVRQALGCGRARLLLQFMLENSWLAAAGGALGLLVAIGGARALVTMAAPPGAAGIDLSLDRNVLLFTLASCVVTTLLFGLVPALQSSRGQLESALRAGSRSATSRSRQILNRLLVAVQVALAVVLVAACVQFSRSLHNLFAADLGFDRRDLIMVSIDGRTVGFQQPAQFVGLAHELIDRLSSLPGVKSTTLAATGFFGGARRGTSEFTIDAQPATPGRPSLLYSEVSHGYLQALDVPVVAGRSFAPDDRAGSVPVAVVNEAFARTYSAGQSVIGRRLGMYGDREFAIVGVVRDAKLNDLRETTEPLAFILIDQSPNRFNHIFVKTDGRQQAAVLAAIRPMIQQVSPTLRIDSVETLEDALERTLGQDVFAARLSGLFGGIAIALVCFGVYGVISYLVVTRTREIGVRLAIGARPQDVLRQVISEALLVVSPGLVVGLVAALALERFIASLLFGASPRDPVTFGAVALLMLATTALAAYVPARRAAKIAPVIALRGE
jgi:predicted permease